MRTPLIAGNWKMNTTLDEAVKLVEMMRAELAGIDGVEKLVCPPFISLAAVKTALKGTSIEVGAQNVYFQEKGAYTGEISPLMLTGLCSYVIIGHSERRQYFAESGELINKKVQAAIKAKLKPILCIGEKLEENEAGKTRDVLSAQLKASTAAEYFAAGLVMAYEPVWAIGTGRAATSKQANDTISFIRRTVKELYGDAAASNVRILYGGSVTADNISELMREPSIDGALVGGASLKADQFVSIVKRTRAAWRDKQQTITD